MLKRSVLLTASILLAGGCSGGGEGKSGNAAANQANAAAPKGNATARVASSPVSLGPGGLQAIDPASGATRMLAFGTPMDQVIAGLTPLLGGAPASDQVNSECGGGPTRIVEWGNGLKLLAQEDRLKGWEVARPGFRTTAGITVDTNRERLDRGKAKVEESSLGTEWSVGEGSRSISGLLSGNGPDGRVTAMWAGHTCHFR